MKKFNHIVKNLYITSKYNNINALGLQIMKKLFLLFTILLVCVGCDNKKTESEKSLHDGIVSNGAVITIAESKNLQALGMIMGCMDNDYGRDYCQCSVDNAFASMTADEIVEMDRAVILKKINTARKLCKDSPRSKIPKTMNESGMMGGEIRSFIGKEIFLDCITSGHSETLCDCFSKRAANMPQKPMSYLSIIDSRTENMFEYILNDESISSDIKKLKSSCDNL